jgi:hypothetical protein
MLVRPRGLCALCIGTCAGLLAIGGDALAATSKLYVSHSPVTTSGKHSCNKPNYNAIQDAVSDPAAQFNTVIVCTGTYAEQVVINQVMTLQGNTGATIVPPGGPTDHWDGPIIQVGTLGGNQLLGVVSVKGLIVDGQDRADAPGTDLGALAPVGIRAENANASISANIVTGIDDADVPGAASGIGILVHASNGVQITNAKVTGNTVEDFQEAGIVSDASAVPSDAWDAGLGITGSLATNVVNGDGITDQRAQTGIRVSGGAATNVTDNQVSGTAYIGTPCDPACNGTGILLDQAGGAVTVNTNSVSVFDVGIDVVDSNNTDIASNTLSGGRSSEEDGCRPVLEGIDASFTGASTGTPVITIEKNTLSDLTLATDEHGCLTGTGIRVDAYSANGSPPVTSTIKGNGVSGFQLNGIAVNGDENTGKLSLNTVTSTLGTQADIAQSLIQLGFGATGTIGGKSALKNGNTLNGFGAYTGAADASSAGILLIDVGPGIKINNNAFNEDPGLLSLNGAANQGGYTVQLLNDTGVNPGPDVNATKNHWGTGFTATDIAQRIYDGNDDVRSGIVLFQPFTP